MIILKVFIFLQSEADLPMIQIAIQPDKTLEDVGQFLYSDQKIHFKQYLFSSKPIVQDQIEKQIDVILPNKLTVEQAVKYCLNQQNKYSIILYNRKQKDRKDKIKKISSKKSIKSNKELALNDKNKTEDCCIIY